MKETKIVATKLQDDATYKRLRIAFMLIAVVLFLLWSFPTEFIVFLCLLFFFLLYYRSEKFVSWITFLFLVVSILFIVRGNIDIAEQTIIYAYYFLIMLTTLRITRFKFEENETRTMMADNIESIIEDGLMGAKLLEEKFDLEFII